MVYSPMRLRQDKASGSTSPVLLFIDRHVTTTASSSTLRIVAVVPHSGSGSWILVFHRSSRLPICVFYYLSYYLYG